MTYQEAAKQIAKQLNLDEEVVKKAYIYYFQFIKDKITSFDFSREISEEEFNRIKINFNVSGLGKFKAKYRTYKILTKKFKGAENGRKEYKKRR